MRKTSHTVAAAILVIALLTGLFFGIYFLFKNKIIKINDYIVKKDDIRGVDISSFQGDVDMEKLKNGGIKFVYIKATEGSSHVDEKFEQNWEKANASGLLSGAYHFFSFDSSGKTQADNFINTVGLLKNHLIPAVDIEYHGDKKQNPPEKANVIDELKSYMSSIEENYGVKPLLYMDQEIYDKYIKDDFKDYPRWIRSVYYPAEVEHHDGWVVWQYSDTGELDSHSGDEKYIDLDVINRNYTLDQLTIK